MSIIRESIKFSNNGINIKIPISSNNNIFGYQQEINNLTQFTTDELINPANDLEICRFKYRPASGTLQLYFYFLNSSGLYAANTFTYAGFTSVEIAQNNINFLNSFFILDFYDKFDINTQRRIFRSYLTHLRQMPQYLINNTNTYNNQFAYLNIPMSYIESQTSNIVYAYIKFSFYSAKNGGGIKIFYGNNRTLTTAEKMFVKVELDLANKTWRFNGTAINLYEMKSTSKTYENRINNTFDKFDNIKQVFPVGNTFNDDNGTYSTT